MRNQSRAALPSLQSRRIASPPIWAAPTIFVFSSLVAAAYASTWCLPNTFFSSSSLPCRLRATADRASGKIKRRQPHAVSQSKAIDAHQCRRGCCAASGADAGADASGCRPNAHNAAARRLTDCSSTASLCQSSECQEFEQIGIACRLIRLERRGTAASVQRHGSVSQPTLPTAQPSRPTLEFAQSLSALCSKEHCTQWRDRAPSRAWHGAAAWVQ